MSADVWSAVRTHPGSEFPVEGDNHPSNRDSGLRCASGADHSTTTWRQLMSTATLGNRTSDQRLLRHVTLVLGILGLVKFLGLFFELSAADAPWGFLIVWVPPFAVAWWLLRRRHSRAGAILAAVLSVLVV